MLELVAIGGDVWVPSRGGNYKPFIICDNANVPAVRESSFHAECASNARIRAFHAKEQSEIFLCPRHWTSEVEPMANHCPRPIGNRQYVSGVMLGESQWSTLLHELLHIYIGVPTLDPEVYSIWGAPDLPASKAVINPTNYVFFLASMCKWFLSPVLLLKACSC